MHAGDALWYLYGGLAVLDRKHSNDPDHLLLIQRMRECAGIIGTFISIPEPPPTKMNELIDQLMVGEAPALSTDIDLDEEGPPPERPTLSFSGDGDNTDFATTLLDAMVECGEFDWSEFVLDLHHRLHLPDPYFTPKMWRAIISAARKNEDFWGMFEENNPECAKHGMQMVWESNKIES